VCPCDFCCSCASTGDCYACCKCNGGAHCAIECGGA
jgi:hypothetical protein